MTGTLPRAGLELDRATYLEQVRPGLRARLIPLRASRRVRLGDAIACEFENADTLLYQVQEMLMVEGSTDEAAVSEELAAYSRLLPSPHSLTCTFFVEADDVATVKDELLRLTGVQHAVALHLSPPGHAVIVVPGLEVPGPDEDGPSTTTAAVHFLRFTLDDVGRDAFRDPGVPASLVVDHPEYVAATPLTGDLRLRLLADLSLAG